MNKGGNLPWSFAAQLPGSLVTMRLDPASPPGKTPLRGGLRAGSHRRWGPFLSRGEQNRRISVVSKTGIPLSEAS
jgi:hypothetical protein